MLLIATSITEKEFEELLFFASSALLVQLRADPDTRIASGSRPTKTGSEKQGEPDEREA